MKKKFTDQAKTKANCVSKYTKLTKRKKEKMKKIKSVKFYKNLFFEKILKNKGS